MGSITWFVSVMCLCVCVNASPLISRTPKTYKYYTKADWGGAPSTDHTPLSHPVPYVVIHHTYIPGACNTTAKCSAAMRSMQRFHQSKGWGDIGYSFCIGSEAGVYEGIGWDIKGIHAGRANSYSVGICLIGDWRVDLPPQEQLEATKALIDTGVRSGKISADYRLIGHNQAMSTECPGSALSHEISTWEHFYPGNPDFTPTTAKPDNRIVFDDVNK